MIFIKNVENIHIYVSRILYSWIFLVVLFIVSLQHISKQNTYYQFGPNPNLILFGIVIDTTTKYCIVIFYCIVNTFLRNATNDILHPWLIHNVQDETKEKHTIQNKIAYEITIITTIYNWFDWILYMNILLSQLDLVFVEIISDVIVSCIITSYYLKTPITTYETIP
jgi:hypothetical protein